MWKHLINDYLSYTKKDRTGIIVLVTLVLFFILLPFSYPYFIKQKTYDHLVFEKAIASLKILEADSLGQFEKSKFDNRNYKNYNDTSGNIYPGKQFIGELFYFDPNSASPAEWKKLGVRDKTIATIQNYLSKGGKFYKKEDIGKIWGFHEDEIRRLIPYIRIEKAASTNYPVKEQYVEKKTFAKGAKTPAIVDINLADTGAFIALPGIGSKLSQRIVNFRDKLGGFYKMEQIGETFGLPDSTFQKIKSYLKISDTEPRRININTATIDEMKSHPYIRYGLANAIIQYRTQHGRYASVESISKIAVVTEEVYNKLAPYLTVN